MEIQLTKGMVALVDAEDYQRVSQRSWYAKPINGKNMDIFHAVSSFSEGVYRGVVPLGRFVLDLPYGRGHNMDGLFVKHKNGNKLDNQRKNLQVMSWREKQRGVKSHKDSISGFKGVVPAQGRWKATISINGKAKHIGYFDTEQESAIAYNQKAIENYGEFALINDV